MIIKMLQTGYRSEPAAKNEQYMIVTQALRDYMDEVRAQYREYQYQKASEAGDTKTMNAMNWEDIVETLINGGVTGKGAEWLHSVSDEIHQWFLSAFNREPSKANTDDLSWLKNHIHNYDFYKASLSDFNQEVFDNIVVPSLKRSNLSRFQINSKIAMEAADEAYRTFLQDYRRQPEANEKEIARLFSMIFSVKYTEYVAWKEQEAAAKKEKEQAEQQRKEEAAKMREMFMEMHKDYFDKYPEMFSYGFNNAVRQFRDTYNRKPTTSAENMAKLSEIFLQIMNAKGWAL